LSLHLVARVGTHDPTNSFKAYSTAFLREVGISSDTGFEMGIEMVAKAHRRGLPIAEIPTIWLDRRHGQSNFKVREWIPRYLHWYLATLGGKRRPMRAEYAVHPLAWQRDDERQAERQQVDVG
jgi:hypothetical protein